MQNEIITFTSPKSSVSEIFRTLRTNVQFMNISGQRNSVMFTSTQAGDGKSWIAANLAITFAQAGKKVILVDTDMRRGRQHNIFELPNNNGLSNYLILSDENSEEAIKDYIRPTTIDNLYIITSGIVPPNPSELLASGKMVNLIKLLEKMADIVIFDSTPGTMVTDAMVISRYVSSTIIVASHKKTKMEGLKQLKKNIENVGGKVSGVILNRIPLNKREYGKSYYYESSVEGNIGKRGFGRASIFGGNTTKLIGDGDSKEEEQLDKNAEQKDNDGTQASNNADQELNTLLKQLTNYLETK